MSPMDFETLWDKLSVGDESVEIEAKRAEEAGKSLWETISASGVETLVASRRLCRLRDLGLLEPRGRSTATYYVPTDRLQASWAPRHSVGSPPDSGLSGGLSPPDSGLSTGFDPVEVARRLDLGALPAQLAEAIRGLGDRDTPEEIRVVIRKLCAWRPLKSSQLAALLNRGQKYLRGQYLGPMIGTELEYIYPASPAHPRQAYRTIKAARGRGE